MNNLFSHIVFAATLLLSSCSGETKEPLEQVINRGLTASAAQAKEMARQ